MAEKRVDADVEERIRLLQEDPERYYRKYPRPDFSTWSSQVHHDS